MLFLASALCHERANILLWLTAGTARKPAEPAEFVVRMRLTKLFGKRTDARGVAAACKAGEMGAGEGTARARGDG